MFNIVDILMYIRYFKKVIYLYALRKFKKLDFVGRIDSSDKRFRGYEGCYPVKSLLKDLKIKPTDSIVDIGAGKGLFLYYALNFDFKIIDGIEKSLQLSEYAKKNIEIINDNRLNIYCCDARNFSDYYKYNYFFINNPFSAEIMEEVVINIKESYNLDKRRMVVIYQFPFQQKIFINHGFKILYEKFPNTVLTYEE